MQGRMRDQKAEVEALLDEGQVFLAQDLAQNLAGAARADAEAAPEIAGLYALSLIRSGAVEAASDILDPIMRAYGFNEGEHRRSLIALQAALAGASAADAEALDADQTRALLSEARSAFAALMAGDDKAMGEGALTVIGDCYLEMWRKSADPDALDRAWRLFASASEKNRQARPAALAILLGLVSNRRAGAAEIAARFRADDGVASAGETNGAFWRLVGRGASELLDRRVDDAVARFAEARELSRATSHRVTLMRALLGAVRAVDAAIPEDVEAAFSPPRVVVFTGLPFDRPGDPPRCPPSMEEALRAAIRARLDTLDAQIGYAAGACGADLIFCEAMLERSAEINLVLPFATKDFIAERVAYLDPSWPRRFEMAAKLAASVTHATPGPFLGDQALFRFGNQALHGVAAMRARLYGVEPELLTVWDMQPGAFVGDVADFIDRWADMRRLHIIDLDMAAEEAGVKIETTPVEQVRAEQVSAEQAPAEQAPAAPAPPTPVVAPPAEAGARVIRALLMSDIVGSSRVGEADMPAYARFMADVAARLAERAPPPDFANTWGDAIFATSASAVALASYALALKDAVAAFGDLGGLIDPPLAMRISLNAGPVLEADDPIAGRAGAFGVEIVRAARIEPVTTPNQIYATDAFVSLLIAEESEARATAEVEGRPWASPYRLDYIGRVKLAKNAGAEGLHHLSAATGAEGEGAA